MSIIVDQIVVSDKFKHNNERLNYFIGYLEGGIVKLLCIILPQMSGYIKFFKNGGKNMSFLMKCGKNTIKFGWDAIKNKLGIKFHSEPVYEYEYLKATKSEFNGVKKSKFFG